MKKLILLALLSLFHLVAGAPPREVLFIAQTEGVNPFHRLYEAVCEVESGSNPLAYNAKEGAVGIVQIRQVRLNDYTKKTGKHYTIKDCYREEVSKEIFMYYAFSYGAYKTEEIVRCWNGGPEGMRKLSTRKYYRAVLNKLGDGGL